MKAHRSKLTYEYFVRSERKVSDVYKSKKQSKKKKQGIKV